MTLRTRFILYLLALHSVFAALALGIFFFFPFWLFFLEGFFLVSLFCGIKLINSLFGTLELINSGVQFIEEKDFTSHFQTIGQVEMDQLISVYNKMVDNLKDERIRIQEQNFFLDKILTASPSGILICDFDNRITSANPSAEKILRTQVKEILGKELNVLPKPFSNTLLDLGLYQSNVISLQGGRRIKCHCSEFIDRGFTRRFFLLEELTDELRYSEKNAYEKLIRMMSHEINNSVAATNSLLNSCLNYKNQLIEEDKEDYENALSVIILRNSQLNVFMNSFAEVIRLPNPKVSFTDVKQILESLEILLRSECQKRSIKWCWEVRENIELIEMDKIQMEQVFVNILKNAIEAIENEGTITIKIGKEKGKSYIAILDTGKGIKAETQAKLFTPFFSTKENGQGVGLMLIQEILTKHNFEFSLESQIGKPTQFTIFFR
ncbi:MAG: GHKL domain-containing protein [Acidobacteria bacterium]|nr:GHKL domain-containing protein [Acidobacteriota bacterium]